MRALPSPYSKGVRCMQVQIFVEPVARYEELAKAMNAWLAAHSRVEVEDEKVHIFHNHTTNADDVLVMLLYRVREVKARREAKEAKKD
jgi:hypothetical protein